MEKPGALDKLNFKEKMKNLETIFVDNVSVDRIKLYYEQIEKDFSNDDFENAYVKILKTEHRFPSIATFYKHKPQFMNGAF